MSDKARELLEQIVAWWDDDKEFIGDFVEEIRAHLEQPEVNLFVRLSEEEVSEILSSAHTPYEAVCATENRLVEKNR